MDWWSVIFLSFGLAMDCFAVSAAKGLASGGNTSGEQGNSSFRFLLMALLFGLFQGGMPLIGYYAGMVFADFISRYAPWIALALLSIIGGKMILESVRPGGNENSSADMSLTTLLLLAVATSIDALTTGVIFIPYPSWVWSGVSVIAAGSFVISLIGWYGGRYFGQRIHFNVGVLGGMILIGIGLKIWIEGIWC